MKRKTRIGLIVVSAVLALLIAVPTAFLLYLRFSSFEKELSEPHPDAISQSAEIKVDKTVALRLPESSLHNIYEDWFAPIVEKEVSYVPFVSLDKTDFRLAEGGTAVYADATVLGFIKLHAKAPVDLSVRDNLLSANIRDIQLGRLLTIPVEYLQNKGLPDTLELDLTDRIDVNILTMTFNGEYAEAMVSDIDYDGIAFQACTEAYHTAASLWTLSPDSTTASEVRRMLYPTSIFESAEKVDVFKCMISSNDPSLLMKQLLSLNSEETAMKLYAKFPAFAKQYVYSFSEQDIRTACAAVNSEIEAAAEPYEKAMTTIEEDWCTLDWQVRPNGIYRKSTGKQFSLSEFDGNLCMNEDNGILFQINSTGATEDIKSYGMPYLSDISYSKSSMTKGMPKYALGVGVYLTLPCGEKALMYHLSSGELRINLCSEEALATVRKQMPGMNVKNNPYFLYVKMIKKTPLIPKAIVLPQLDGEMTVMVPPKA